MGFFNAYNLANGLGVTLLEIDISAATKQHLKDIGQDENDHSVTFENAQARERTQVLMDYANKTGGLVIGTGDLSELALGWATYNGDHMSNYGVNCSIPKTLVKHIVYHYADLAELPVAEKKENVKTHHSYPKELCQMSCRGGYHPPENDTFTGDTGNFLRRKFPDPFKEFAGGL